MKKNQLLIIAMFLIGAVISNAQESTLYNFTSTTGITPQGSLMILGNKFYGMTSAGGAHGYGSVFSVDTNGTHYKDLYDFSDTNDPDGSLIFSQGLLFGMTSAGGASNHGCVFSIDTDGAQYKDILDFNKTNGARPLGSLVLSGNVLYGMTYAGGTHNNGCIFSVDTNGVGYTTLLNFNDTVTGSYPYGSLVLSRNTLFGMTSGGGAYSDGVIFSIDTNGNRYENLHSFYYRAEGAYPRGSFLLSGSVLYGMTYGAGGYGDGTIFAIDTDGNGYNTLFNFRIILGSLAHGDLIVSGNTLYGMTSYGGMDTLGNVFSIGTNGKGYKDIWNFSGGKNGANPYGDVIMAGNSLYGMTSSGGTNNGGVVFRVDTTAKADTTVLSGINELTPGTGGVKVFPNPNNGLLTVALSGINGRSFVDVYNMLGEKVYVSTLNTTNTQLDLTNMANGLYLYRVVTETGDLVSQGKFIIQK